MGSPWSPPAWMKTGNSLNGGSLRPEHYGKCLSVDNSSTADGAGLSQQPCSGSPAQAFTLTR